MKRIISLILAASIINFASAVTFNSGTTGGTILVPGDYATLKDAADTYNSLSGGIHANWIIEITADFTEPALVSFGNLTNSKTLTIKPQAGKSPTITFSSLYTPSGVYGNLIIGLTQAETVPTEEQYFESTNGYIIDGNNGGIPGDRNMTFQSVAGNIVGRVVTIFGRNNGVIVRNLNIIQGRTGGTVAQGIRWAGGSVGNLKELAADGGTIENCHIDVSENSAEAGQGIITSPGSVGDVLSRPNCFKNLNIINNVIIAQQRGIFLDRTGGTINIKKNKITLSGRNGAYDTMGIYHFNANNSPDYVLNIEKNILDLSLPYVLANHGVSGILIYNFSDETMIPPAGDVNNNGTVNILNNIIKKYTFTASTPEDIFYRGISAAKPRVTYKIEHNSINMQNSGLVTGATAGNIASIYIPSSAATSPLLLKNNIIRNAQTGTNSHIVYAEGGNITSEGNDIFPAAGSIGIVGANLYANFSAWQAAGYDTTATGGQSADPAATVPAWDANLKFRGIDGLPYRMIGVASSTVLRDIDDNIRPSAGAAPGADEPVIPTTSMVCF